MCEENRSEDSRIGPIQRMSHFFLLRPLCWEGSEAEPAVSPPIGLQRATPPSGLMHTQALLPTNPTPNFKKTGRWAE